MAVYNLLFNLDTTLAGIEPATAFAKLQPLFEQASNQRESSLENIVNTVGNLLNVGADIAIDSREALYARLNLIEKTLYVEPYKAQPQLKPQYQNLQIVDASSLADSAKEDTADGFAYRYALKTLNPFAITGNVNLYSQHNQHGELNIDKFSDNYLQDRARFLELKNEAFTKDGTIPISEVIEGGEKTLYRDLSSDVLKHIIQGQGPYSGGTNPPQRVTFGTDNAESGVPIDGGVKNDRLYGGGGDDTIKGSLGNDYIEGNAGTDTLYGGADNDTLIGGAGTDHLYGDAGNDTLKGCQGRNTAFGDNNLSTFIKTLLQTSNKQNYNQDTNRDTAHYLTSI
jgi:hypothetical protein